MAAACVLKCLGRGRIAVGVRPPSALPFCVWFVWFAAVLHAILKYVFLLLVDCKRYSSGVTHRAPSHVRAFSYLVNHSYFVDFE